MMQAGANTTCKSITSLGVDSLLTNQNTAFQSRDSLLTNHSLSWQQHEMIRSLLLSRHFTNHLPCTRQLLAASSDLIRCVCVCDYCSPMSQHCCSIAPVASRMVDRSYSHVFSVQCDTEGGEMVAVTGSSPDLGQWRRSSVIPMVRTAEHR